ncbi:MAG TPA: hypothetical protein VGA37_08245 [Gemmatimonadales bacterium]
MFAFRSRRACTPVLFPVLLAWCTPGELSDSAEWGGTVDTLANGTILVSNPAEGWWGDSTGWQVEIEWRLGAVEGDGPGAFGQVRALAVDRWDRLYVLDGQAQETRVFDSAGAFVRTIGREGAGGHYLPGTFFTTRWPGGFDTSGRFFNFIPVRVSPRDPSRFALVAGDSANEARDTRTYGARSPIPIALSRPR